MSQISYPKTFSDGEVLYGADLEAMKAAITSAVNGGLDDANIVASADIDPSKIGDYAANDGEYQNATAPATRDGTTYTTITTSKPTTLEGELARIRYVIKEMFAGIVSNTTGLPVADQWYSIFGKGVTVAATGDLKPTLSSTPATGWILLDDKTIGNASSNATNRAHADTRELFRMMWRMYGSASLTVANQTICRMYTSGGTATDFGADPDTDYAANRALSLPLWVGRTIGVAGTPASANRIDAVTGTQGLTGTTQKAGTSTTVFFLDPLNSSDVTGDYVGHEIRFTSGALSGEVQTISAYDGDTHQVTVDTVFTGTPAASVTYVIYPLNNSMFNLAWDAGPTIDDALNGYTIEITGGTGTLESKTIADYDASQRKITITGTWTTNPDHTTTYSIYKTLTTRAAGDTLGTESAYSTIGKLPVHSHPVWQTSSDGTTIDRFRTGHTSTNFVGDAGSSAGGGAAQSLYQPTAYSYWHVKL